MIPNESLTNWTSDKLCSHRYPCIPSLWVNPDVWSQNGSGKGVSDYRVTITISLENLQKGMLLNEKFPHELESYSTPFINNTLNEKKKKHLRAQVWFHQCYYVRPIYFFPP